MTNDLTERMIGHRTRLAQEAPRHWHDGEDEELERYLEMSEEDGRCRGPADGNRAARLAASGDARFDLGVCRKSGTRTSRWRFLWAESCWRIVR